MNLEDRQLRIEHFTGSEVVKPEKKWICFEDSKPDKPFYWGESVNSWSHDYEDFIEFADAHTNPNGFLERHKFWCDKESYDQSFSEYQSLQKRYEGWEVTFDGDDSTDFKKGEYVLTFHEWGISIWHPKTINLSSEKLSIRTFESILKDQGI